MMPAKLLALVGLVLDITGVLMIGLRGHFWMVHFWRNDPAIFDTRLHKWMYYGAWWAIAVGFGFQAAAVVIQ